MATKAYEDIWKQDGIQIVSLFKSYTGLEFQQNTIDVIIHIGQSWSGMASKPMRLNARNMTLSEKRSALIHELAHRLLFGNGLFAPEENNDDGDEINVYLFQGDVLRDLYGNEAYNSWASLDSNIHTEDHLRPLRYVLSLTSSQRKKQIKDIIAQKLP